LSNRIRFADNIVTKQAGAKDCEELSCRLCELLSCVDAVDAVLNDNRCEVAWTGSAEILLAYRGNSVGYQIVRKYFSVLPLRIRLLREMATEVFRKGSDLVAYGSYLQLGSLMKFVLVVILRDCVRSW
jgi:hypothetical protein